MAKHSRKNSCWIPNSISRYNGVIYAAILRHIGEPSFRKRYGAYLERLKGYLGDIEKEPDRDSCLVEISAAERSVNTVTRAALFDPAAAPLSQTFGLDLSRLSDPDIIERAKLFIQAIKDVPKRFIAAAVLAGMLFAGGENWRDMADIISPVLKPDMAIAISSEMLQEKGAMSVKEVSGENEKLYDPDLPMPLNGTVPPYVEPAQADRSHAGIIKALGMANGDLSEKTKELYAKHIIGVSKKFGLNPALVTGVVIAESTGRSASVSHAGARGLMQVMWSVHGKSLNKKFGYKSAHDLLVPEKGLTAGCWILKGYMERSRGNIKKALSSYLGTSKSGYYYNKIMKWAKIAQPRDQDFKFIQALSDGGLTEPEAKAALKTTVMLDAKGPMDAEELIDTLTIFLPNAPIDRIGEIASVIVMHERTEGGRVVSRAGNAEEAEYMLKKADPDFDREICMLELETAGYTSVLGRFVASVKKFPAVSSVMEKTDIR